MKSKLAIWAFIFSVLPLIAMGSSFLIKITDSSNPILVILALVSIWVAPIAGLSLGIISIVKIKNNPELKGRTLAIAAIIIPIILVVSLLIFNY